jgi:integrase
MASFRKRDGRWQVQVRKVGSRPVSKTFDTKAAAQKWATGVERAMDLGEWYGDRVAGTIGDLIRRHREESKSIGRSKASVLAKLESELGMVRLKELTPGRVIAYAQRRKAEGAGPATLGADLGYLATILRTARDLWQLPVTDQPVQKARKALVAARSVGKAAERDRRPKPQELARILDHLRARGRHVHVPVADIAEFAIATGMRLGEICRIRWDDLDEVSRTIIIRDRKDPRNKVGRNETIPLLTVTGYDPLAMIQARAREGDIIWPFKEGSVSTAWARACRDLGIDDLHLHDLRAEAASRMLEGGMSIDQVALVTGHKTWAMLRRYARLRASDLVSRFAPALPPTP